MIAEKHDRSSQAKLADGDGRKWRRLNAAVYWLTYFAHVAAVHG